MCRVLVQRNSASRRPPCLMGGEMGRAALQLKSQPLVHREKRNRDWRQRKARPKSRHFIRRHTDRQNTGNTGFLIALPNRSVQLPIAGSSQGKRRTIKKFVYRLGVGCTKGCRFSRHNRRPGRRHVGHSATKHLPLIQSRAGRRDQTQIHRRVHHNRAGIAALNHHRHVCGKTIRSLR